MFRHRRHSVASQNIRIGIGILVLLLLTSCTAGSGGDSNEGDDRPAGEGRQGQLQPLPLTPLDVDFVDPDTGFVLDEDGRLARTEDGGTSWHVIHEFDEPITRIDFVSASVGWAMARDGIWSTTDSGASWTKVHTPFSPGFVDLVDEGVAWATDDRFRLYLTTDGGNRWEPKTNPCLSVENPAAWAASFISSNDGWFICGSDEGMGGETKVLRRTADAAGTWEETAAVQRDGEEVPGGLPAGGYVGDLFFLDPKTGWFGTTRYGEVWHTQDGGKSWQKVSQGPSGVRAFTGLDFVTPELGWSLLFVQGDDGWRLARTRDGGANWEIIDVVVPGPAGTSPSSAETTGP